MSGSVAVAPMHTGRLVAATVAAILAVDVILVRRERETFSAWHRRTCTTHRAAVVAVEVYLLAHLWGHPRRLASLDPLCIAATVLRPPRKEITPDGIR